MNYTSLTLGELLSSKDETIKRNAVSILKRLQGKKTVHGVTTEEKLKYLAIELYRSGFTEMAETICQDALNMQYSQAGKWLADNS